MASTKVVSKNIGIWINNLNELVKKLFAYEIKIVKNPDPEYWLNSKNLIRPPANPDPQLARYCFGNLTCNLCQWVLEDKARDDNSDHETIAKIKKNIDISNQHRNNFIEHINSHLVTNYFPKLNYNSPLFSETPGSILDRLHILVLRHNHYQGITAHKKESENRIRIIREQNDDLIASLNYLIDAVHSGKMHFKLYYQLKTYNDHRFNRYLKNPKHRK